MTIDEELTKLESYILNAYEELQKLGATLPSDLNAENLANTIKSINYNRDLLNELM